MSLHTQIVDPNLDVDDVRREAWDFFKRHASEIALGFLVVLGCITAVNIVSQLLLFALVRGIAAFTGQSFFMMGLFRYLLALYDDGKAPLSLIWNPGSNGAMVWRSLAINLGVAVLTMVGFLFLVIPGIWIAIRLEFAAWRLADLGTVEPVTLITDSWEQTQDRVKKLLWLDLLTFGVAVLGFLLLIVGIIPAIGFMVVLRLVIYRRLFPRSIEAQRD